MSHRRPWVPCIKTLTISQLSWTTCETLLVELVSTLSIHNITTYAENSMETQVPLLNRENIYFLNYKQCHSSEASRDNEDDRRRRLKKCSDTLGVIKARGRTLHYKLTTIQPSLYSLFLQCVHLRIFKVDFLEHTYRMYKFNGQGLHQSENYPSKE